MPTLRPRKRASASSLKVPRASPATTTEPVSARSSPAVTMSSVDLPEPEGPTRPMASPLTYIQVDVFEDMNARRAAPQRKIDAAEGDRGAVAPDPEVSCMFRCSVMPAVEAGDGLPRSYGGRPALVQVFALVVAALAFAGTPVRRRAADGPVRIVALGDSPDRRVTAAGQRGLPGQARTGAQGQRHRGRDHQCGRLRRHGGRRAGPAGLVGAGGNRRRHRRARRQ